MLNLVSRYTRWLHTRWPAGIVERLPIVGNDGLTSVPGVRIAGDLTGVPLLKFAADSGARAVQAILAEPAFVRSEPADGTLDLAIVGGGVSGIAAALEARRSGLRFEVFEATAPFSTIQDFPIAKPIFTYPSSMAPSGSLRISARVKEDLLATLETQRRAAGIDVTLARAERLERAPDHIRVRLEGGRVVRARRAIVAVGRTGNHRRLAAPGAELPKVFHRLHDPKDHSGRDVLVVGGGDSALEAAAALAASGARVTLSYRGAAFGRAKEENVARVRGLGNSLSLLLESDVTAITPTAASLRVAGGKEITIPNDVVFTMIGREAPLEFLRRSGIRIQREFSRRSMLALTLFTSLIFVIYLWKAGWIGHTDIFSFARGLDPDPRTLSGVLLRDTGNPSFWFTIVYSAVIVAFGIARIRRRRTPYVTKQTLVLMAIQVVPLFLLPEILLPWLDAKGWIPGALRDNLFPNGDYWRAYGFVFPWPLLLVNIASPQPIAWWIAIGLVQTFVLIPLLVRLWGKGAYCGWICSCGALAETLGDTHRGKMWHGPTANRWNMLGQVILGVAAVVTIVNALSWIPALHQPLSPWVHWMHQGYRGVVDIALGGAIGVGFYFWFSGRVWCRFACPLAALMNIYARFSRFRIFPEKSKCISCNVCTSVCHMGIDVMNFANKGLPMEDPQCVRCSACVESCPTGTLSFGAVGARGEPLLDRLAASPVRMREREGR